MEAAAAPPAAAPRLLTAAAVGGLVALSLGIYGNVHDPANDLAITLGFGAAWTMNFRDNTLSRAEVR